MINEAERAQQLKEITAKFIKVQLIGSVGTILVGLALYAIFAAQGNAFHPLLNDRDVAHGMLIVGGVIMLWQYVTIIPLMKKRIVLSKKDG